MSDWAQDQSIVMRFVTTKRLCVFVVVIVLGSAIFNISKAIKKAFSKDAVCRTGKPCDMYTDAVDFRIIILSFGRPLLLLKLLETLDNLELDGDTAAIEIWIDVNREGRTSEEILDTAKSFKWKKGPVRVHLQTQHAGIAGQWIDTYRPKNISREICMILEDDLRVSPMAYRFVKAVHRAMAMAPNFAGVTIQTDERMVFVPNPNGVTLNAPKSDSIFMYKGFGTWGFSPEPELWRNFQVTRDVFVNAGSELYLLMFLLVISFTIRRRYYCVQ